jgi:hypothetical protein
MAVVVAVGFSICFAIVRLAAQQETHGLQPRRWKSKCFWLPRAEALSLRSKICRSLDRQRFSFDRRRSVPYGPIFCFLKTIADHAVALILSYQ